MKQLGHACVCKYYVVVCILLSVVVCWPFSISVCDLDQNRPEEMGGEGKIEFHIAYW